MLSQPRVLPTGLVKPGQLMVVGQPVRTGCNEVFFKCPEPSCVYESASTWKLFEHLSCKKLKHAGSASFVLFSACQIDESSGKRYIYVGDRVCDTRSTGRSLGYLHDIEHHVRIPSPTEPKRKAQPEVNDAVDAGPRKRQRPNTYKPAAPPDVPAKAPTQGYNVLRRRAAGFSAFQTQQEAWNSKLQDSVGQLQQKTKEHDAEWERQRSLNRQIFKGLKGVAVVLKVMGEHFGLDNLPDVPVPDQSAPGQPAADA